MDKPENLMLPDSVLKVLVCSLCQKFLSVRPIKVYPGGIITCGRCQDYSKGEGYNSFLNEVIEQSYFPCVNRYEECQQALKCDEVVEHEKYCETIQLKCPICDRTRFLSAYEIVCHFKSFHSGNILSKPEFVFTGTNTYYLYWSDKKVYMIIVQIVRKVILITVRVLCPEPIAGKIIMTFDINNSVNKLYNCLSGYRIEITYNSALIGILKVKFSPYKWNIFYTEINYSPMWTPENQNIFVRIFKRILKKPNYLCKTPIFEMNYPNFFINSPTTIYDSQHKKQINLVCGLCQQFFGDTLCYSSRFGKYLCGWCAYITMSINKDNLQRDEKHTKMYGMLGIKCKYGCKGIFNLMSYVQLKHEDHCSLRPLQKCPVKSCKWKDKMSLLEKHFTESHPRSRFTHSSFISFHNIFDNYDDIDDLFLKIGDVFVNVYFEKSETGEILYHCSLCPINNSNDYTIKIFKFETLELNKPKIELKNTSFSFLGQRPEPIKQQEPQKHVRIVINRNHKIQKNCSTLLLQIFILGIIFYYLFAYKRESFVDIFFNYINSTDSAQ